jgi:hypothetical protein
MSAPPPDHAVSVSTSGYEDGLGRRTLVFDREGGGMLERLQVRPELAAFEAPLRERMARLALFEDDRFARVQGIERDPDGSLIVVSGFVAGTRVCDLLDAAAGQPGGEATSPGVDAAIGFLLEVLPALAALHSTAKFAHGAVAPGRLTLTPAGGVVILDSLFGQALDRLQFNRHRLWSEFQIAMPPAGPARFDVPADISQAFLTAMMIVVGRMFREDEVPQGLASLLAEVVDIAQISGSTRFAFGLQAILERTLPLKTARPYASASEAAAEVRQLAQEIGIPRCRAALNAFVADMSRGPDLELADEEEDTAPLSSSQPPAPRARAAALAPEYAREPEAQATPFAPDPPPPSLSLPEIVFAIEPEPDVDDAELIFASEPEPDVVDLELTVAMEPEPVAAEPEAELIVAVEPPPETDSDLQFVSAQEDSARPSAEPAPLPDALLEMLAVIQGESPAPPVSDDERDQGSETPAPIAPAEYAFQEASASLEPPTAAEAVVEAISAVPEHVEPEVVPAPPIVQPVPAPIVQAAPPPSPPTASGKNAQRKSKRGSKRGRNKLRSAAIPAPRPAAPTYVPPVIGSHGRAGEPLRQEVAPQPASLPQAVTRPPTPPIAASSTGLRVKTERPAGYTPVTTRFDHRDITGIPYVQRGAPEGASTAFPWKLAAAALAIMVVGVGAGRVYLSGSKAKPIVPVATSSAPVTEAAAPATPATTTTGAIEIVTQPAGTRVLLDGKPAGETPLTIDSLAPGRHTLTFLTTSGSLKRVVRVEAGKTAAVDVAVYSGWVAVFAPIALDIAENGRGIGSTEQGRLMLSPGRHLLTLTNRELGYTSVHTVEIEPGEERAITVQPVGELNANAQPWAEVWIDGQKVGDTPLARLKVPLGTHEIVFKHPQFGERRITARVTATAPVAVTVDFAKQSPQP